MTQLADVGNDIWVGNYFACQHEFDLKIHIYHESQRGLCSQTPGLLIIYKEHDPLSQEIIKQVWEYAQQDGKLLIHCAAGLGRTPTFAIIAKVARGCDPFVSLSEISKAMWTQYAIPHMPSWDCKVLNQIMQVLVQKEKNMQK